MEETQSLLRSKIVLLVEVSVLKLGCGLLRCIDALSEVCKLEYDTIIGYRPDYDVIVVNGLNILLVAISVHKKEPFHAGFLWENFYLQIRLKDGIIQFGQ